MGADLRDLADELRDAAFALVDAASAAGLQPRITSVLRSDAEQGRLYRRFLAGRAGYPVVAPGHSAHGDRGDGQSEAFDMVVTPMDALADVGYTWMQWGGGWSRKDAVHFELPGATARAEIRGQQRDAELAAAGQTPWWLDIATLGLSTALTTKSVPCTTIIPAEDWRCQYFSYLFCCK